MMSDPKSVIIVPAYHHIEPETERSLQLLEKKGFEVWREFGISSVDLARSILASRAYYAGYEWLYWIDSDILFEPADFLKLVAWDESLCCAPYAIKSSGGRGAFLPDTESRIDSLRRNIVPLQACGFGFVKSHRIIYEAMSKELQVCFNYEKPLIPFFQPGVWEIGARGKVFYGEDYNFCLKARQLGFHLFADFSIKIGHIGRWAFTLDNPL